MERKERDTPWSLKGVRPEVRDMAKAAAAAAGIPIGAWLSAAIRMVAEAELRAAANESPPSAELDLQARIERAAAGDGGN